tara:strand:- start:193 stop:819 length:627 start_codon:yes stop_codon:yes gene_type:complete
MTSGTDPIKGIKDWKRYIDRVEPEAFSGVTDTINKTKDKLLAIAGLNRDNKEDKTDTTSNEGIFSGTNTDTNTNTDTDNKNFDFTYGGLNPTNFNPNASVAANFGGNTGFYADANADASLKDGLNYDVRGGYKGDNIDAKIDTEGLQIGTGFGGDDANVNVNLAQDFGSGDTNVNVEGKKQLNKYLNLGGFANTKGDYGASLGFDFKF